MSDTKDPKAAIPHAKPTPALRQAEALDERAAWEEGRARKEQKLREAFDADQARKAGKGGSRGQQ